MNDTECEQHGIILLQDLEQFKVAEETYSIDDYESLKNLRKTIVDWKNEKPIYKLINED